MIKEGTKVYFVNLKGDVEEFTVVKRDGSAPCKGCDILIENQYGHIYSGDSKSYLPDKKEALFIAKQLHTEWLKRHQEAVSDEQIVLNHIISQLVRIENEKTN